MINEHVLLAFGALQQIDAYETLARDLTKMANIAFYWLTVLVTFALGTAVGDWTLELPAGRRASPRSCPRADPGRPSRMEGGHGATPPFSSWLHQDLEHRLAHFHTPVLTIRHEQKHSQAPG